MNNSANEMIYGLNDLQFVVLEHNTYKYSTDTKIISLLKDYAKVQFDNRYNSNIDWLPEGITDLHIGTMFNKPLDNLPSTIKSIIIQKYNDIGYTMFNNSLDNLPPSLECLKIYYNTKFNLPLYNLPKNLKYLHLQCLQYTHPINNLPDSLEYISIKCFDYNNTHILPKNLKIFKLLVCENEFINNVVYDNFKILQQQHPHISFIYL